MNINKFTQKSGQIFYFALMLVLCGFIQEDNVEKSPLQEAEGRQKITLEPRTHFGRGVGFPCGYSTFQTIYYDAARVIDLRGHFLNDNSFAGNAGVGYRWEFSTCYAVGINAFYDFRHDYSHTFNQAGIGLELFGHRWGVHLNGYVPFGKRTKIFEHCRFDNYRGGYVIKKIKTATMLGGADLRIAVRFLESRWFQGRIEAGPYVYRDFLGVLGNVTFSLKNCLNIQAAVTHDPVFGTRYQGEFAFTFTFGEGKKRCSNPQRPVSRAEIIPLFRCCHWETNY